MDLAKYQAISRRDYEAIAGPDWPVYSEFQLHQSVAPFVYEEIDAMLVGPRVFDNTAFCVLPFYARELPADIPCCYLPPAHNIKQIKKDMLVGRRPTDCQKCWRLEDSGIKSNRQINNETVDFYFNQDLSLILDSCQQGLNETLHYKIDTSNTCNSTCITCGSLASSLWGQLESRNGVTPHKNWSLDLESFEDKIDFARAKSIGFRGGEPLLSPANFKILEKLIEHGNTDCFINFQTNGGVELSPRQKDILSNFTNVNMSFSIDGVGPVFEYMRYPLKWSLLLKNIDYYRSNNIIVSACYTLSNINALYHEDTCAWFDQNRIRYILNLVYYPNYFRPSALPKLVKDQILKQQQTSQLAEVLATHGPKDDVDYAQFQLEIAQQDLWKGILMQDYLPDLHRLLG